MRNFELTGKTKSIKNVDYFCYDNIGDDLKGLNFVYPKTFDHFFEVPDIIKYISVLPGSGKTRWAIKKMIKGSKLKDYIYFYIAPTLSLLKQVKESLIKKGMKEGKEFYYFSHLQSNMDVKMSNKFVDTLEHTEKGKIFLITHALYLSSDFNRKKEIFAIIDEAQLIGVKNYDVRLKEEDLEFFKENVDLELLASVNREYEISGSVPRTDVEQYFKVHSSSAVIDKYKRKRDNKPFLKLLQNSVNPKLDVYIMPKPSQPSFFSFVSPKHSFQGYGALYLMGAFFHLSELYHILMKEGHYLKNVSEKINAKRETAIKKRFMKLKVQPLTDLDRHLSKYLFDKHLVFNSDQINVNNVINDFSKVSNELKDFIVSKESRNSHVNQTLKSVFTGEQYLKPVDELVTPLRKKYSQVLFDPFKYMVQLAEQCIETKKKPLLIVNSKYKDSQELNEKFSVLTTSVHGLNKYKKRDTLIFLAALNAKPTLSAFYKHFIPTFSQESHWIASNVVQAMCRLHIRDVKTDKPTYLIVATIKTARLIREILNNVLSKETIERRRPIVSNVDLIVFDRLLQSTLHKPSRKKSYLIERKKGDLLEIHLTTEQRFRKFPEYDKLYKEQELVRKKIARYEGNKTDKAFKKLLDLKLELADKRKALKAEIAKKEGFNYRQKG